MLSGQTKLTTAVYLLDDSTPEDSERFSVALINPRQGAEVGPNSQVLVNIQSSDDGHGVIEFAEVRDSLLSGTFLKEFYFVLHVCLQLLRDDFTGILKVTLNPFLLTMV